MAMRKLRHFTLLLLLVFVTGCSSTTFIYNRLDFFIPWYLGDYVDLDREQKAYLDELLQPFLGWHRTDELPQYLQVLDDIDARLNESVSSADVGDTLDEVEQAWLRVESRALDWLLALGADLSDEQIALFIEELRDKQVEYEEKYLTRTEKEYREDAEENLRDNLQDMLGRLDKSQRARVVVASGELRRSDAVWLQERAEWIDLLEQLLTRQSGWQDAVRQASQNREERQSALYRQTYEHNIGVVYAAVADVLNIRSTRQDERLRRELNKYREAIEILIAQGVDEAA
ncbi:MAG: DUF6279 family lipoprotein [Halioglobus sp.]